MRILVCGGRDFKDELLLSNTLAKIISESGDCDFLYDGSVDVKNTVIISGCARGADTLAIEFAKFYYIPCEKYPADWKKYPKAAGPIRNQQMLKEGKPDLVVAFPGGKGTAHMIKIAKDAGVKVIEIKND